MAECQQHTEVRVVKRAWTVRFAVGESGWDLYRAFAKLPGTARLTDIDREGDRLELSFLQEDDVECVEKEK